MSKINIELKAEVQDALRIAAARSKHKFLKPFVETIVIHCLMLSDDYPLGIMDLEDQGDIMTCAGCGDVINIGDRMFYDSYNAKYFHADNGDRVCVKRYARKVLNAINIDTGAGPRPMVESEVQRDRGK